MSRDNYSFNYSRDDIEWLADQLAGILVSSQEQQQVQVMTIDMLDTLSLDAIASAVAGITDPIGQLKDWLYDVLKKFANTIINAVTSAWAKFYDNVIAPVLNAISSAISALYDTLSSAMNYLTSAISAINDALDKVVVQPILDALQWVQNVLPELGNLVSELIDDIYQAFSKIGDKISEIAGKISDTLSSILDNISSTLVEMLSTAGDAISSLISGISDAVDTIASKIADVAKKVSSTLSNILDTVTDKASSLLSGIADVVSNILDNIRSAASKIASTLSDIVDTIRDRLSDLVSRLSDIVSDVADNIRKAIGSIADKLQDMLTKISNTIGSLASKIVNTLRDIGSKIADIARSVASKLGDIVSSIASRLESLGSKLLELLSRAGNEIEKIIASVTDAANKLLSGIEDAARKAIHGIQEAVTKAIDTVFSAIRSIADKISELVSKMTSLIESIGSKLLDIVKKAASEIHSALSSIYDKAIKPLATKITDALTSIGNKASSIITSIVDKVKEIPGAIDSIARKISGAFSTVANYLKDIGVKIKDILTSIAELFNPMKLVSALGNLLRRAAPDVYQALEATLAGIHSPLDAIKAYPRILGLTMLGLAKIIWYLMPDSVKGFFEHVADAVKTVGDYLMGFVNAIMKFPEWFPKWFYEHIAKPIVGGLEKLGQIIWEHLPDFVKNFFSKAIDFFTHIPDYIGKAVDAIVDAGKNIVDAAKMVYEGIKRFIEDPLDTFKSVLEWLWEHAFKPLGEAIVGGLEKLGQIIWEHLPDTVKDFLVGVKDTIVKLYDTISSGVKWFIDHLPDIKDAIIAIKDAIVSFFKDPLGALKGALEWLWENALKPLGERIYEGLEKLGEWLWEKLPDNVKTGLVKIGDFFKWLYDQLQEFAKDPKGKILGLLEWLWDKTLGAKDWLMKHVFTPFMHLLGDLWEKLSEVLAKIGEVTVNAFKKIGGPVFNALRDAFKYVSGLVLSGVGIAIDIAKTLLGKIRDFMSDILPYEVGGLAGALLAKVLGKDKVGMVLSFAGPFTLPVILVGRLFEYIVKEAKKVMPLVMQDPVSTMYGVMNLAVLGSAMGMLFTSGFRALARVLKGVRIKLSALLRPLGVGVGGESDVEVNLGEAIQELTNFMDKIFPDVARYLIIGHMIWWAEPTRAITRYWLTNYLTIELPPMEQTMRSLRRHLTTPLASEYYRIYVEQLRMGGISQRFIDYLYPLPEDLLKIYQGLGPFYDDKLKAIVITDRFGQERVFPVSLVAEIPTPSELAHMMIRDIILNPKDFAAVMGMHGFTPDVAFMFYLLHFRYPSPEKLASFFWRGVAGELWNPDESYDKDIVELFFKKQKKGTQLPIPKAPKSFNFASKELFEIMKQYMKWHDYARIPWHPGWPTDNAIIMDLIADIPGKIDLRWMSRWGLFDYWGAYGKKATSTIEDITTSILIANQTASAEPMIKLYNQYLSQRQPVFDVRQFARALQATGLHPYWVPWVTVAETINALSEERTLLRTGFINLFREGLWPLDTLNKLLAGFFTVVFKTAYFDPNDFNWKEVDIEYPVAFLPAESKLLELRALMDKALDIYREAYRRIIRAIAFHTVSVEQGKAILADIVLNINEKFFVKEMERISGKTLALQLDEGYWGAWSTYARVLQEIEAVERTRFYARYIIWNVLWALRYGYTTQEEAEKWVNDLVQAMNEHPRIKAMIEQAVRFMLFRFYKEISVRAIINKLRSRRMSVEEAVRALMALGFDEKTARLYIDANVYWYTPSIVTYASMLEVVPEALSTVLGIIEHLNLPSDEYLYWVLYLLRQPTRDELTLVRTRIYQLLALGMQPDNLIELLSEYTIGYEIKNGKLEYVLGPKAKELLAIYEKARTVFQAFGIAPQEWALYNLIALMEQKKDLLKAAEKERIPSPTTIASLAEYLVLPEDLVKKTLEEYHVSPDWLPYWLEYIRVKPLKSDYKNLLTVYIRALRYGAVSEKDVESFIKELEDWGFTPREIDVIRRRVDLEEAIAAAREYMPTPFSLATLSEYMVLPESLVEEAFEKRHVPEEWRKIWLEYIRVRPLKPDYRSLLSVYIRALRYKAVSEEEFKKFLEELSQWGFTPKEIELITRRAALEEAIVEAREAARLYIPTPTMLATLSEYMVLPEELVKEVFEKRHVPPKWQSIWLEYIRVRPLKSDFRRLLSAHIRAMRYGIISRDEVKNFIESLRNWGFTPIEIQVLEKIADLEAAITDAREYIPTPSQLATIAEYVPAARTLIQEVLVKRHVPKEWWPLWIQYVHLRPLSSEVREVIRDIRSLYEYFAVRLEDMEKALRQFIRYGLESEEIALLVYGSQLRAALRAYRELVGTPRQLVSMAEYSPKARRLALAQVYKMIDALPVDQQTKEFLKKMWEEYIRVRPVYDEVRRYITELINDYANGLMTDEELKNELEALKDWGLDDYEIQFYIWLAQRRRVRYAYREMLREMRSQGYFGL